MVQNIVAQKLNCEIGASIKCSKPSNDVLVNTSLNPIRTTAALVSNEPVLVCAAAKVQLNIGGIGIIAPANILNHVY